MNRKNNLGGLCIAKKIRRENVPTRRETLARQTVFWQRLNNQKFQIWLKATETNEIF